MDAIRAAFESQFGTEWSNPVTGSQNDQSEDTDVEFSGFDSDVDADEQGSASDASSANDELDGTNNNQDAPVVIKHDDSKLASGTQHMMTKSQRRKFMNSGAPRDDTLNEDNNKSKTKEDNEDLKNDLALQRLIEESHILSERTKGQEFTGADVSGAVDPMEQVGKTRLKVMEARLAKAGAKRSNQRMPQAMAVGIRDKRTERKQKTREEAKEAGIVLAKDRHVRSKNRTRDKGLKINTVGRASEHGIHISQAEIARISGKSKSLKKKRR